MANNRCPGPIGEKQKSRRQEYACDGTDCPMGGDYKVCKQTLEKRGYNIVYTEKHKGDK